MNSPITKLADGRYTVGQMIGTGGMADVYLGLDTRLDREVWESPSVYGGEDVNIKISMGLIKPVAVPTGNF